MFDLTVQCECHCNVPQDASNLKQRKTEIVTFSSSRWTIVVLPDHLLSMMSNRDPTDKPEKHHWHLEFCSKVHILFLSQSKHIWHQDVLSKARHYRAALCDFWSMPLKSVCAHTCESPVQVSFWLLTLHHSLQSLQPGHGLTHCCLRHRVVSLGAHRSKCTVINRCSV